MGSEEQEWASLLGEIFEKLTAKHTSITYEFNDLKLQGERTGEEGISIPTGTITLSGKLTISSN